MSTPAKRYKIKRLPGRGVIFSCVDCDYQVNVADFASASGGSGPLTFIAPPRTQAAAAMAAHARERHPFLSRDFSRL